MSKLETYLAVADTKAAKKLAKTDSPFTITVRFMGGLNTTQKNAFKRAADRWSKVIVGDLPSVTIEGDLIDDVLILASGQAIDGAGTILGQAGPTRLRPASAGASAFLPAKGEMMFDTADLAEMEAEGTLVDVITHEMGHVLGIGTIWTHTKLLKGAKTANPTFVGPSAMAEYAKLKGTKTPTAVPVENGGGEGTRDSHWRETIFRNELMSGFVDGPKNPLSRVTVASLADLGYVVNMAAAEKYKLPDLFAAAEAGTLLPHGAPIDRGFVQPILPMILPDEALTP